MELWKQRVSTLEKKVEELSGKVDANSKTSLECHYATFDKEMGEYSLEELDNFRFKWGEYTEHNVKKYNYIFQNPPEDLLELLNAKIPTGCNKTGMYQIISSEYGPDEIQDYATHISVQLQNGNNHFAHTIPIAKEIKTIIQSKPWTFSKDGKFTHTVILHFKNTYTILPHWSFYTMPFVNTNVSHILKNITCKNMTIEFTYGTNDILTNCYGNQSYQHKDVPADAKFHWLIQGIVDQKDIVSDLLGPQTT